MSKQSPSFIPLQISILGAGKIGLALTTLWIRAGHSVCLGARNPEKLQAEIDKLGLKASVKSIKDAAEASDIVVLAVPYPVVQGLVSEISNELKNKILIDATNPFGFSPEGHVISTLGPKITAGTHMANLLPESTIVRAFTHIMDELLVSRGTRHPGLFAMAIAGDDPTAKATVAGLVSDTGFVPIDIGNLAESLPLDPGGILFAHVFTVADMKLILKSKRS
ncbi:MAG: NADPH-dependent F420 reductase [Gammaproteobacteria bacterium]|nr:NADPH-dependent F420 reductase [Gammaproteobacteria bacterium]